MNYRHELETIGSANSELQECNLCGLQFSYSDPQDCVIMKAPCPEKIVRETERRLNAELQNANIVPAKRKDRQR